jgi:hypothetical protein
MKIKVENQVNYLNEFCECTDHKEVKAHSKSHYADKFGSCRREPPFGPYKDRCIQQWLREGAPVPL